jgi:NAD(P)-dependent dehydrogenase (short-subunit alcohol dehydrogenase family)
MDFEGKTAIITGGSSGMGRATAELLAKRGCDVYVFDIKPFQNEKYLTFLETDIRDPDQIGRSLEKVLEKEDKINFLFASAGIHLFAGIEDTSLEQFENVLAVNLKGMFYTVKQVLPIMRKQEEGSVVLMGSDQCFIGKEKSVVYGLTKGAIGQMTKSLAQDYAPYNIRVNCICPGTIDTPMLENTVKILSEKSKIPIKDIYHSLREAQPIKRLGTPQEIAEAVVFLLSDKSKFTTGTLFSVDGGHTCR